MQKSKDEFMKELYDDYNSVKRNYDDSEYQDFVKLDKPVISKRPVLATLILWLVFLSLLWLLVSVLPGCASVKYKSPCNVQAIGYGYKK
jgi:hypothetical protein